MELRLQAFLVDDEILASRELRNLLATLPEINVVGEAQTLVKAAEAIEKLKPNVVFLDVELRDGLGFDLIPQIDPDIEIIFVTAYDHYALRAFEINALDYLTKPIDQKRLKGAVERLFTKPRKKGATSLVPLEKKDRLLLRLGNKNVFISYEDIVLIQACGDYTEVSTKTHSKGLIHRSMHEWEISLPKDSFFRTHRSAIINTKHLLEVVKDNEGEVHLVMENIPNQVTVSRRNLPLLRKLVKIL